MKNSRSYGHAVSNGKWVSGTSPVAVDTDAGLILMSSDQALEWLRSRLEERDLVGELLADRRREVEAGN